MCVAIKYSNVFKPDLHIENKEMIVAVNAIYEKKKQYLNGVWTRDLEITGAMLYQPSHEVTDVGSRSIVGSYVPVKDMSVNDIWNKPYMNCGNEMKYKTNNNKDGRFYTCS